VILDLLSDAEERKDPARSAEAATSVDVLTVYQQRELPRATKLDYAMTRKMERTVGAVYRDDDEIHIRPAFFHLLLLYQPLVASGSPGVSREV
jgi:hypothetical protein